MSSRRERKAFEREQAKAERKKRRKNRIKSRIEEFKLNRQGKTKRRRTDVMARHRRVDRVLNALLLIVALLLVITWIIVLFY